MSHYIDRSRRSLRRKPHRYDLAAFGLDEGHVDDHFADYVEAYGLGTETDRSGGVVVPLTDRSSGAFAGSLSAGSGTAARAARP